MQQFTWPQWRISLVVNLCSSSPVPSGEFLQWWVPILLVFFLLPLLVICSLPPHTHIEFTEFYELFCHFPCFCSLLTAYVKDLQEGKSLELCCSSPIRAPEALTPLNWSMLQIYGSREQLTKLYLMQQYHSQEFRAFITILLHRPCQSIDWSLFQILLQTFKTQFIRIYLTRFHLGVSCGFILPQSTSRLVRKSFIVQSMLECSLLQSSNCQVGRKEQQKVCNQNILSPQ